MEKSQKKSKIMAYIYILMLYILVFQNFLQIYIKVFQYVDEAIAVIGILVGTIEILRNKLKIRKDNLIIITCLFLIIIIGFASILMYHYQEIKYALIDCLLVLKFFLAYFLGYIIFKNYDILCYSKPIVKNIKIISIILFLFTIANYAFDLYSGETRFGIKSNQLFYSHPTYLVAITIMLTANKIVFSKKKFDIYTLILLLITMSTLRIKALGIVFVTLIIMVYVFKLNKKISISKITIIGIVCILIAYPQIEFYLVELDENARKALMQTSGEIANDYFPIGTGFGTFASFESGENYSPIYNMYGISEVWGLEEGEAYFVADSFWPMILGQFGYLGCILYTICIVVIFIRIQKCYNKENKYMYVAKLICLAYLVISSTSESAFANSISIPLALLIGM